MEKKHYKRQYREQEPETKQKISATLRGRQKSSTHKANISKAMIDYWSKVPSKYHNGHSGATIEDIML